MKSLRLAALSLLLALCATQARAAFDNLGAGARAPGMGNAFTAVADDLYAVYYNPAGLAQVQRPQFSAAYSKLYVGLTDGSDLGVSQMTYAHPLKKGRWGTFGTSLQRFALDSLYSEQSLYLSWGRRWLRRDNGSTLLGGLNFKQLSRSFSAGPEAGNAIDDTGRATGQADPVLSGSSSKGTFDADLGLLYRLPRNWQFGMMIEHFLQPDVGYAAPDKLPMNMRFGAAYKSLWMNLTGELRMEKGAGGATDRDIVLAGERYFPSLDRGQFGIRGGLGFGARQWRQMSMGFSYRINKIQTDYAFIMPLGGIKGTMGTHRIAMTFHFGAPTAEEEISQDLLNQAKRMQSGQGTRYGYEFLDAQRPHTLDDPLLAQVKQYIEQGLFRKAHEALVDLAKDTIPDESIVRLSNRLELIASYWPEFGEAKEPWEKILFDALKNFARGRDRLAVLQSSYAFSLTPADTKLDSFLARLEEGVGLKAERLPAGNPRGFIEELLYRVEAANSRSEHEKVLSLLQDITMLTPNNVTAIERTGSTYYILGRYQEALQTWERAMPMETNAQERQSLVEYIDRARGKLGMSKAPRQAEPEAAPAKETSSYAPAAPVQAAAQQAPAPRPVKAPAARRSDPQEIERLYQRGVEHYARGEYLQATAMFMRILQIDPENAQARKALDRIQRR
ncbi:MAG: type IX secretion system membrane protein PorP/SprF [Elusimicrobiota bacterium]|jgi:tetratricopeptide (TPR) repeat protein